MSKREREELAKQEQEMQKVREEAAKLEAELKQHLPQLDDSTPAQDGGYEEDTFRGGAEEVDTGGEGKKMRKLGSRNYVCQVPRRQTTTLNGHTKGVNCVKWSPTNAAILGSASMDGTVKLWNTDRQQCVMDLSAHQAAVRDFQFNRDGSQLISGGYDKTVKLFDVNTGACIQNFVHREFVTAVVYHPSGLFLSGGARAGIVCWDPRSNSVVNEFQGMFGQVQSLEMINKGHQFVSSSDVTRRNSTDKAVIVWDFQTGVILSNQPYQEAYTCPCIRAHPSGHNFVAQSNANYIAIFSTSSPYKLNKRKRFEGHQVSGYHINCNISPDGEVVVTGSADGSVYFYNWHSSQIIRSIKSHRKVCMDAAFHPSKPSMVATCSWDGTVSLLE